MLRALSIAVLLALAGCKTTPVAGECADNVAVPCATRRVCTEDTARGCMRCTCESPLMTPQPAPKPGEP